MTNIFYTPFYIQHLLFLIVSFVKIYAYQITIVLIYSTPLIKILNVIFSAYIFLMFKSWLTPINKVQNKSLKSMSQFCKVLKSTRRLFHPVFGESSSSQFRDESIQPIKQTWKSVYLLVFYYKKSRNIFEMRQDCLCRQIKNFNGFKIYKYLFQRCCGGNCGFGFCVGRYFCRFRELGWCPIWFSPGIADYGYYFIVLSSRTFPKLTNESIDNNIQDEEEQISYIPSLMDSLFKLLYYGRFRQSFLLLPLHYEAKNNATEQYLTSINNLKSTVAFV